MGAWLFVATAHTRDDPRRLGPGCQGSTTADFHAREIGRLTATLLDAAAATTLPDRPTASPALHDLLVRLRLGR